jgi:hypothetical protein
VGADFRHSYIISCFGGDETHLSEGDQPRLPTHGLRADGMPEVLPKESDLVGLQFLDIL